jgi:hypothetical protein
MSHCLASFVVFAQLNPQETSLVGWMIRVLTTFSFSSLMVLISGLLIFGGACYLIVTKRRPAVLAACLVLLPLPVFIAFFGVMSSVVRSLSVIASSPDLAVSSQDFAGGTAASLVEILFAILISAPTYFVLAFSLLTRTLGSPNDSTPPALSPSQLRQPLFNSSGPKPATT